MVVEGTKWSHPKREVSCFVSRRHRGVGLLKLTEAKNVLSRAPDVGYGATGVSVCPVGYSSSPSSSYSFLLECEYLLLLCYFYCALEVCILFKFLGTRF